MKYNPDKIDILLAGSTNLRYAIHPVLDDECPCATPLHSTGRFAVWEFWVIQEAQGGLSDKHYLLSASSDSKRESKIKLHPNILYAGTTAQQCLGRAAA